jgi:hypothetical protein
MTTTEISGLIGNLGLPAAILIGVGFIIWRIAPKLVDAYKAVKAEEMKLNTERQSAYTEQTSNIVAVAARTEVAINSACDAIRQSADVSRRVADALEAQRQAMELLISDSQEHDNRAENMNIAIHQILENLRKMEV